jgi:hypothetical protein
VRDQLNWHLQRVAELRARSMCTIHCIIHARVHVESRESTHLDPIRRTSRTVVAQDVVDSCINSTASVNSGNCYPALLSWWIVQDVLPVNGNWSCRGTTGGVNIDYPQFDVSRGTARPTIHRAKRWKALTDRSCICTNNIVTSNTCTTRL